MLGDTVRTTANGKPDNMRAEISILQHTIILDGENKDAGGCYTWKYVVRETA